MITVYLPVVCAVACGGLTLPNAAVGALVRQGSRAGTASALLGTLQYALAAGGSVAVRMLADGTARPIAAAMLLGALGTLAANARRPRG